MIQGALGRRLLTHITLRLVAATVLLGLALVVELGGRNDFAVNPFFALIAVVYAASLLSIASLRYVERFPWLTDVHFSIDVVVVTACVALTGGVTSLFSWLYVLPIVAASTVQFRRGALQIAAFELADVQRDRPRPVHAGRAATSIRSWASSSAASCRRSR